MSQKTPSASESRATQDGRLARDSRAALAAARVAQRYAQAPSYSQLLADEARAAMRAAEAASKAAQEAQAAVQYMLDGLEAAAAPRAVMQPEVEATRAPASPETPERLLDESPFSYPGKQRQEAGQLGEPPLNRALSRANDRQTPASPETFATALEDARGTDTGEPIYANLIQFPRPMVATRRMRPRRAEGPLATAPAQSQLSIFEVDPGSISTLPAPTVDEPAAPVWMRAEAASIELEPQPVEDLVEESTPQAQRGSIQLAPFSRRVMALIVDASFALAAFLSVALLFASHARQMPGPRTVELCSALAVLGIAAAYETLFFTLARATPGMRYAGIALSTFDGHHPTRAQRCGRLMALLLSVLPLGLGLVWAVFDEDHLMGHDRLSKTYLRKR
jgi:uncharacterized RDD family membrane protein YckC